MTLVTAVVKSKTTVSASTNSVQVGGDVRVVNSNGSFDETYTQANSPVTLPNITKTDSDGTTSSIPSNEDVTCTLSPIVTVGIFSDAGHTTPIVTKALGDTIYVTATPSNITPTAYRFYFQDSSGGIVLIYEGANGNSSWVVAGSTGIGRIFAEVTDDDENWIAVDGAFTTFGVLFLDVYTNAIIAPSLICLRILFAGGLVRIRNSNNSNEADFTPTSATTPPIIALDSIASNGSPSSVNGDTLAEFITTRDGFASVVADQSTYGNDLSQSTAGNQPSTVSGGVVNVLGSNPVLVFDGSSDVLTAWNNETAPVSFQGIGNAISIVFWVRTEATSTAGLFWYPNQTIVECRQNNSSNTKIPFSVGMANNKLSVGVASDYSYSFDAFLSTDTYTVGATKAYVVTIENNTIKMYIDGALDSTHTIVNATGDRSIGTSDSSLSYGSRTRNGGQPDENYYNGKMIHAPIIFPSVLTAAQVLAIYNDFQS